MRSSNFINAHFILLFLSILNSAAIPFPNLPDISLLSSNAVFNYRVPGVTVSLEISPFAGRPTRHIRVQDWDGLISDASTGIIDRSRVQGGLDAIVRIRYVLAIHRLQLLILPDSTHGGDYTFGEMNSMARALLIIGRSIEYREFTCTIFRNNDTGQRVRKIGLMVLSRERGDADIARIAEEEERGVLGRKI
ncbi:MAG: hypothetical protein Q9190_000053 [Brigantiaea leucoxantha]